MTLQFSRLISVFKQNSKIKVGFLLFFNLSTKKWKKSGAVVITLKLPCDRTGRQIDKQAGSQIDRLTNGQTCRKPVIQTEDEPTDR